MAGQRRIERLREMIYYSLALMAREGINNHLNTTVGGPWTAKRVRGWGAHDSKPDGNPSWHTFADMSGPALVGLFQTAFALQEFLLDHPEMVTEKIFVEAEGAAIDKLRILSPYAATETDIDYCINNVALCLFKPSGLTYGGAQAVIRDFGAIVMRWWVEHGMQRFADPDVSYFFYAAPPDYDYNPSGHAANIRYWLIHNSNVLMGRALFLYNRFRSDTSQYRELALHGQLLWEKSHFSCYTEGGVHMKCRNYGIYGNWLRQNFYAADDKWLRAAKHYLAQAAALEDPEHYTASQAMLGISHGHSLLNGNDYRPNLEDDTLEAIINKTFHKAYRAYHPSGGCTYFTQFQCLNKGLADDLQPAIVENEGEYLKIRTEEGFFPLHAWKYPSSPQDEFLIADHTLTSTVRSAYVLEGGSNDNFELLFQWWDAHARANSYSCIYPNLDTSVACKNSFGFAIFAKTGAFLGWASKTRTRKLVAHNTAIPDDPSNNTDGGGCGCQSGPEFGLTDFAKLLALLLLVGGARRRWRKKWSKA